MRILKENNASYAKRGENNPNFGKKTPKRVRRLIALSKIAEKNPMWKGDRVSYISLHQWIRMNKPSSGRCEMCGLSRRLDASNNGIYDRDFNNWTWLCRKCHMKQDGRSERLALAGSRWAKAHLSRK